MRYVLLIGPLPPPNGGVATWVQTLFDQGLPAGWHLDLIDTRVARHHWADWSVRDVIPELRRSLRIVRELRSYVCEHHRVDLAHLCCSLGVTGGIRDLIQSSYLRRAGIPYVIHLHGGFEHAIPTGVRGRLYRWTYRPLLKNASMVFVLSERSGEAVSRFLGTHDGLHVLPNFIDFSDIPPAQRTEEEGESEDCITDSIVVTYVGSVRQEKGINTILSVAREMPDVVFNIIGEIQLSLRSHLVSSNQIGHNVELWGDRSREEVMERLSRSDVFFFPTTHREGFPMAVAEAMAAGLPVVASSAGALTEMIDEPEGGFIRSANDISGYVEVLRCLQSSSSRRKSLGQYNRLKAAELYGVDKVIERMCKLYDDTLNS